MIEARLEDGVQRDTIKAAGVRKKKRNAKKHLSRRTFGLNSKRMHFWQTFQSSNGSDLDQKINDLIKLNRRQNLSMCKGLILTTRMIHPDGNCSELFEAKNLREDDSVTKCVFVYMCINSAIHLVYTKQTPTARLQSFEKKRAMVLEDSLSIIKAVLRRTVRVKEG